MSKKPEYQTIDVDKLTLDPANARAHPDHNLEAIKGSLAKFGQQRPILVDRKNTVIAGNGTLMAAKALGWDKIDIRYTDLSGPEAIAYALADNRTAELAEWDKGILGPQLQALYEDGFDIAAIGFDPGEFLSEISLPSGDLEMPSEDEESLDPIDDIPEDVPTRVKLGDRWQLGKHILICGDSGNQALVHSVIAEDEADAIVTDPPYGLEFMGKEWDRGVPSRELWDVWFSRIKPGGHIVSFSGTRTYHLMTTAIEQAGFEVRDMMQWLYGQGFPKSQDISKAIDKAAGAERKVVASKFGLPGYSMKQADESGVYGDGLMNGPSKCEITAPATIDAQKWSGWGTALKPANEPICLARKPLSESTIAKNVLLHGTGGLNIDGTRIVVSENDPNHRKPSVGWQNADDPTVTNFGSGGRPIENLNASGRFPSNVILDEEAAAELDLQTGDLGKSSGGQSGVKKSGLTYSSNWDEKKNSKGCGFGDSGGASRFFYIAKASKSERNAGMEGMPKYDPPGSKRSTPAEGRSSALGAPRENFHPTVKPISLMRYLVKLITPPAGLVLEPFCGSGTTLLACEMEGARCIAFELEPKHCDIILARFEGLTGKKAELLP